MDRVKLLEYQLDLIKNVYFIKAKFWQASFTLKHSIFYKIYFSGNIKAFIENLTERLPVGVLNQRSNLFEPGELMVTNGIIELIEVRKKLICL